MAHPLPTQLLENCGEGTVYCLAEYMNTVTNGFFWMAALLAFCVVLFIATSRFGTTRAFGFSSIVGGLASVWLLTLELMVWGLASVFILTGAVGFVVLILNER